MPIIIKSMSQQNITPETKTILPNQPWGGDPYCHSDRVRGAYDQPLYGTNSVSLPLLTKGNPWYKWSSFILRWLLIGSNNFFNHFFCRRVPWRSCFYYSRPQVPTSIMSTANIEVSALSSTIMHLLMTSMDTSTFDSDPEAFITSGGAFPLSSKSSTIHHINAPPERNGRNWGI